VLRLLGGAPRPMGITEVADELGLPKATVFRLLRDLAEVNCVISDEDSQGYRLAPGLIELGELARRQIDVADLARPVLEEVAHQVRETVNLGVLHDDKVLVVDSARDLKGPRLTADLGPVSELYCSALGKALLSCLPGDRRERMLDEMKLSRQTEHTITSVEALRRELDQVRRSGVAYDREEYELGLYCIAVPVRRKSEAAAGAISACGPVSRLQEKQEEVVQYLRDAAGRLIPLLPGDAGA